jgi:hypothetical protein
MARELHHGLPSQDTEGDPEFNLVVIVAEGLWTLRPSSLSTSPGGNIFFAAITTPFHSTSKPRFSELLSGSQKTQLAPRLPTACRHPRGPSATACTPDIFSPSTVNRSRVRTRCHPLWPQAPGFM